VNCSALPENLIESELFGHERGAFTDAHAAKPGLFEVADGGTLLLDEIGTLPPSLQAKLLRVLQDKQVRRVGGTKPHTVDVRIIAATNEDLRRGLTAGRFRQDLYYRLGVITLSLPTLRERGEDVLLIAESLLARLAPAHGLQIPSMKPEVRRALLAHHWPGNVRELKNSVERALLLSEPGSLDASELVPRDEVKPEAAGPIPFPAPLEEITSAAAREMLQLCRGNRSEAARRLDISRRRLRRLLEPDQSTE
jgi:DNA-binding NtrC family response regulator